MKKTVFILTLVINSFLLFSQTELKHNPWELIIYRPENSKKMNDVRCWLKIEDMQGNDVTYSTARATYEWASIPNKVHHYERTYYLMGGMAMHLHNIKPGKYKFSFFTPADKQYPFPNENKEWKSNIFLYNTENPTKVIFVYPTEGDNGFYDGGWIISTKAPAFYKFSKPGTKYTK